MPFDPIVVVCEGRRRLYRQAAVLFVQEAEDAVRRGGRFCAALPGGSAAKGLLPWLTRKPFKTQIPWKKTFIFFGDERFVPPNHKDSNFGLARKLLFSKAPLPRKNIFAMGTDAPSPEQAAKDYEVRLRRFFRNRKELFDLTVLGMGADGHTASLFPDAPPVPKKRWVAGFENGRISLTFTTLNSSRRQVVLISGKDKIALVKRLLKSPQKNLPVQNLRPRKGRLLILGAYQ